MKSKPIKKRPHKAFAKGDWVKKGNQIGKVEWTENKVCNCPESDGYMAVDLKYGNHGLACFEKRDDWDKVSDEEYAYFTGIHSHNIVLTVEQKEQLRYYLTSCSGYCDPAVISLLDQLAIKH